MLMVAVRLFMPLTGGRLSGLLHTQQLLLLYVQVGATAAVGSVAASLSRTGLFPHGVKQRGSGVVSDRAIKHLHELTQLQQAGRDALGRWVHCAVLFVVNR